MFMTHPFQAVVETCDAQARFSAEGDGSTVRLEVMAIVQTSPAAYGSFVKFEKVIDAAQAAALLWLINSPFENGSNYPTVDEEELSSLTDTMYKVCKPISDELKALNIRLIP